ncbi:ADP-ribose pyrophosphatase YjhB, NUDIX family [Streptoalloteichus tenebrarius]|uniref:ADP-ribose pyrophosphatase YjhB, NUDIX family n=1 Tax=Streptoalloteichus tenebrarius (strain ATCC 17920 / DSM 40477 / JCM 4838 / CBS 697.72 / NBRC 16177 / NCIMB 11028 / NRRL B-12390 / A12253. 1 / ISP 5477) TaxID=1933 RepID=A0ABT1HVP8_STRSD|nr:NUDIX domain-containing protein [Streptoalloteichus tenebrarius]MCP2259588.1 ADP-ribose pyrophosphatase YjhB, NUDIX family [Streptoalloteichus tenebrarius]
MTGSEHWIIRCVGAIVHDADGRLLLVQRGNDPGRGRWSVPGGRVEPGESDAAAVAREVEEETGLSVRVGPSVGVVRRPAPTGTYLIVDYAAEVSGGTLRAGDDALAVRWVDDVIFDALDRSGMLTEGLAAALREWGQLPRPSRR